MWGSVLYFVILFLCTAFAIMVTVDPDKELSVYRWQTRSILYQNGLMIPSVLMAIAVPTVVALLVYRFVHSKKQAVFVHSLPVGRTANFISTVLAAFTLMFVPVILNSLVLIVLSLTRYSEFFSVSSCLVWAAVNLLGLFVMFSFASFCAVITGNSFSLIALNGLIHSFLLITVAGLEVVAGQFLFGYVNGEKITSFVLNHNSVYWLMDIAGRLSNTKYAPHYGMLIFNIILAIVFYGLSFALYKLRRLETADDVAGFKCLNPIFKYIITFLATLATFSLCVGLIEEGKGGALAVLMVIISFVAYFAVEMVLKKTLRVWRAYKGYIAFAAGFAAMMFVFMFTSFFGYETFVPMAKDVDKATIYSSFGQEEEPYVKDRAVIEEVINEHSKIVADRHLLNTWTYSDNGCSFYVTLGYEMNNGDIITRGYNVTSDRYYDLLEKMYQSDEYKGKCEELLEDKYQKLESAWIYTRMRQDRTELENADVNGLFEAMKKDIQSLGYKEICGNSAWGFEVGLNYIIKPEKDPSRDEEEGWRPIVERRKEGNIYSISTFINKNYVNTIKWIKDNGYGDVIAIPENSVFYISRNVENYDVNRGYEEFNPDDYAKIDASDGQNMINFAYSYAAEPRILGDFYKVYCLKKGEELTDERREDRNLMIIDKDKLPEFLKKYVN